MEEDIRNGYVPFFVSCTLGTTSAASFDALEEIGEVTQQYTKPIKVWLHVDGAYGGNSFICPEMRGPAAGLRYAYSFNVNPNKWLLTSFDCSCLWVKDRSWLTSALKVHATYLPNDPDQDITYILNFRNYGTPMSRRFRSLKLWFMLRLYGIEGLQKYIRNHCELAKIFSEKVLADGRFELCNLVNVSTV